MNPLILECLTLLLKCIMKLSSGWNSHSCQSLNCRLDLGCNFSPSPGQRFIFVANFLSLTLWRDETNTNRIPSSPSRNFRCAGGGQGRYGVVCLLRRGKMETTARAGLESQSSWNCPASSWTITVVVLVDHFFCWSVFIVKGSFCFILFFFNGDQKLTTVEHLFVGPSWILQSITALYTSALQSIHDEDQFLFCFNVLSVTDKWIKFDQICH